MAPLDWGSQGSPARWLIQVAWVSTHPPSFRKFKCDIFNVHHYGYARLKTLRVTARDMVTAQWNGIYITSSLGLELQQGINLVSMELRWLQQHQFTLAENRNQGWVFLINLLSCLGACLHMLSFPLSLIFLSIRSCCGITENEDINMVMREILTCGSLYCFSMLACKIRITKN